MKNVKIRLSIPLIKGGIDSASKLDSFINKTSGKVDEYVVRTLYPHTVDLEKLYVDFEYSKGNVIFERENNLDTFSGLILWTDSNLYSNWDLVNQKHLYSYMLLKPDSQSKIDIILDYIKSKGFEIINILKTDNFDEIIYIEVGALMVGKIVNFDKEEAHIRTYLEKEGVETRVDMHSVRLSVTVQR